jgi:fatty-acyl-CoA synthase
MPDHAIAPLLRQVAARVGSRDALRWRDRTWTWRELDGRFNQFANTLLAAGIGGPVDHAGLAGWESAHDHVAIMATNGNEYLEAMFGSFGARAAPVNVNYRYVAHELHHVLADCRARALIFHARYAPIVNEVRGDLEHLDLLLQVDDESDEALLAGALPYAETVDRAATSIPAVEPSPEDHYVLYTGGTTGKPKGTLWRQSDFLHTALAVRDDLDTLLARAERRSLTVLATPPFMHGAAHWNVLSGWIGGATVVIQDDPTRLDPADVLDTVERHGVSSLLIVGDAFAQPLLAELESSRGHDLSSLRFLLTGGAILSADAKARFLEAIPGLRVVDLLGSSETGNQGTRSSTTAAEVGRDFERAETTVVLSEDRSRVLGADEDEWGWLAQSGRVPRGYLGDPAKSTETFPQVDGVRYAVAGDRVRPGPDGTFAFGGRDSVTINTGGEKVFAEEVEEALRAHRAIRDVTVVGCPDERWGQAVTAVVSVIGDPSDDELRAAAAPAIAGYKLPRAFVRVDEVVRSPSGKPDYTWARRTAIAAREP